MKERSIIGIAFLIALAMWGYSWILGSQEVELVESKSKIKPMRIISLGPNITEILFALGVGEQVVGVTSYCNYPEAAKSRKNVGNYITPNIESVLALKPDLIIAPIEGNLNASPSLLQLSELGLRVVYIKYNTFDEIPAMIIKMGNLVGATEKAKELVTEFKLKVTGVQERAKKYIGRPLTLMVIDRTLSRLVCSGPGSFQADMLRLAGGHIFPPKAQKLYPSLTLELILKAKPEVIIESNMAGVSLEEQKKQALEFWGRWKEIPAVRTGRIYLIDSDIIDRLGPRAADGLVKLTELLHKKHE